MEEVNEAMAAVVVVEVTVCILVKADILTKVAEEIKVAATADANGNPRWRQTRQQISTR